MMSLGDAYERLSKRPTASVLMQATQCLHARIIRTTCRQRGYRRDSCARTELAERYSNIDELQRASDRHRRHRRCAAVHESGPEDAVVAGSLDAASNRAAP